MKRIITMLLCFCLMLSAFSGMAEEDAWTALLGHIASLMDVKEQALEALKPAWEATAQYCEENTYELLVLARVSCEEAIEQYARMNPPAFNLSREQVNALTEKGIETDILEQQYAKIGDALSAIELEAKSLKASLFSDIYFVDTLPALSQMLQLFHQINALRAQADCLSINALLLPAGEEPSVRAFWNAMPERWPLWAEEQKEWIDSESDLLSRKQNVIEQLKAAEEAFSVVADRAKVSPDHLQERAAEDGVSEEQFNAISDMPFIVPAPEWLFPDTLRIDCSWKKIPLARPIPSFSFGSNAEETPDASSLNSASEENDGENPDALNTPLWIEIRDELPEMLAYSSEDVSKESFDAYVESLLAAGAEAYQSDAWEDVIFIETLLVNQRRLTLRWISDHWVIILFDPSELTVEFVETK